MLQIRPNCECCDVDLSPNSTQAYICSYECTFCEDCTKNKLLGKCPNCLGELVRRPIRSEKELLSNPASTKRIKKEHFY